MLRPQFCLLNRNIALPCNKISESFEKFHLPTHLSRRAHNRYPMEVDHNVSGIMCREVDVSLPTVGTVTILEATAQSQDLLVNMALSLDEIQDDDLRLQKGDPYGAVLWPAASALARYLLTNVANETPLSNLSILELGTGTGLVSMAASLAGAQSVLATDYEEIPLTMLKYAMKINHQKRRESDDLILDTMAETLFNIKTDIFDICAHDNPLPRADIMLAADIMYELKTGRALAHRVKEALSMDMRCIIACSPGRPGRRAFTDELQLLLPNKKTDFIEIVGNTCSGPRHDLICGKDSPSISENPKALTVALLDIGPNAGL